MNCVQIQLQHAEIRDMFIQWFREKGFDVFMQSQLNGGSDPVTCLTTDETIEHEDHYFELE